MFAPQRRGALTVNRVKVEGEWIYFESEHDKQQFKTAVMITLENDSRWREFDGSTQAEREKHGNGG